MAKSRPTGTFDGWVRVPTALNNVVTIMVQQRDDTTVLGAFDLAGLSWNSGPADVLHALLEQQHLSWSDDGKELWRIRPSSLVLCSVYI